MHRDVKPANVLLARDDDHAYLSDFGLMRALDPQVPLTDSGRWMGTVDFAAPEQLERRARRRALGRLLAGLRALRRADGRAAVPARDRHRDDARPPAATRAPRPSASGAPASFDRVIARALAKEPADRYPSAGDLGRAALAAARGEHVTESERTVAVGPAAPDGGAERRRRQRWSPPAAAQPGPDPGRRGLDPGAGADPRATRCPGAGRSRRRAAARRAAPSSRLGRRGLLAALALPLAGIATVAVAHAR